MPLGDVKKKTEAQRLRAVLFCMWQEDNKGFEDAEDHYVHHMEKLIDFCKGKLKNKNGH